MKLEITGMPASVADALDIAARIQAALRPADGAVRECRVRFIDENGPKGGVAIRCTLHVGLVRRADFYVSARAASASAALTEALDRVRHRLARVIGAQRDSTRHPKKYFAAVRASMRTAL
jgi:hypothetical protein